MSFVVSTPEGGWYVPLLTLFRRVCCRDMYTAFLWGQAPRKLAHIDDVRVFSLACAFVDPFMFEPLRGRFRLFSFLLVRRQLAENLIKAMGACKRCENCGAYSPNIRKDGSNKLFQASEIATTESCALTPSPVLVFLRLQCVDSSCLEAKQPCECNNC